ncbi:AI-2E family transporter [Patescibacteria group bacterium]|nr:AI-2E family transporter [Patescibacteria group bacterium]
MENKNNKENVTLIKFDIWSIAKIFLIFVVLWLLYLLRDVIFIVLVASLLATIINPMVNYFEKKKIPRWAGALFVYLAVLLVLILVGMAIVPAVVVQSRLFIDQIPEFLTSILNKIQSIQAGSQKEFLETFNNWLNKSPLNAASIFSVLGTVVGQVMSVFMVFILAFYISVKKKGVRSFIDSLVPIKYKEFLLDFSRSVQKDIGSWVRGLLLLCLFIGVLAYLGLLILGVKFALILAVIAGLTEVIPYLGPFIGAIPAVLIAFTQSPSLALFVIILFIVIQQIENALISPYVMHKAVGLDPLVIILALLVGGKLAGPIGMVLAVPAATIITILIRYYLKYKKKVIES